MSESMITSFKITEIEKHLERYKMPKLKIAIKKSKVPCKSNSISQ